MLGSMERSRLYSAAEIFCFRSFFANRSSFASSSQSSFASDRFAYAHQKLEAFFEDRPRRDARGPPRISRKATAKKEVAPEAP